MNLRFAAIVIAAVIASPLPATAEGYPDRVVRIVNPFPPGGSVDVMARLLAQKLSENTGQQFIVETRAGAGGNIGADSVAKSEPDGYTLLFTAPGPLVVNQTLYAKGLPYDPARDFAPIALFAISPIVLMVNPELPVKNVQELIAYAKKHPGEINFGSAGNGSTPHLSGELFKTMADVRDRLKADPNSVTFAFPVGLGSPLHISVVNVGKAVGAPPGKLVTVVYESGSDVAAQAAGNHIDVGETSIGSAMPLILGGKLRMLGIASPERLPGELAKFPTLREQGVDVVTANSYTVLVPNGLAPEQMKFWIDALDKVLADPDFKLDLDRNFWVLDPIRYPETVKWLQDDYDENRAILNELGMIQ